MTAEIAVSIINFRTAEMTIRCAESVLEDPVDFPVDIVIVDNNSGDGSLEKLDAWKAATPHKSHVHIVRSPVNSGFSGGHNQAMACVEAAYYLLLNSDTVLRPGFLKSMHGAAVRSEGYGLFAPRIVHEDGMPQDSCFRFHGPLSELIRAARLSVVTRLASRYDVSLGPTPDPEQIEWASFACVLLDSRMVREIGPMDEGYFLYFEDAEYCLRAHREGWRIKQIADAEVVHFRGGSGPVKALQGNRARLPRYFYSSRTRFLYQRHGFSGLIASNLLWYIGRGLKNLTRLAGRDVRPMTSHEWQDIWTNTLRPLGPRYAPWEET